MKKLASMVGIGVISMTVALGPAFAQQSNPLEQPGASATVQPKTDSKTPAVGATAKDEKNTAAKPGSEMKNEGLPAKPAPDVKSSSTMGQSKPDTKAPVTGLSGKDEKNAPVKPGASLKNDKPAKSVPQTKIEGKNTHRAMKTSHKHGSAKNAKPAHKTRTES